MNDTSARYAATEVARTLRCRGFQSYFVGGCVRDLLLGRDPADYDVATNATPDEVMAIFARTFAVGAQFGVVLVEDAEGICTEVATFRSDVSYTDGRHPDAVRFSSTPEEDVQRRDFTINGMMLDPLAPGEAQVLDFVGGREDLAHRLVRTIGDPYLRFSEDKLRMLRAVRFAARFRYLLEPATFSAIRELAPQIKQVSRERLRDELLKMLTEGQARRAFELLDATGLLTEVLPEVAAMKGVDQPPQYHPEGDVWTHTLMMLDGLEAGCSRTLALGVLLHDVGKPPTFERAPDRIRFNNHAEVGTAITTAICVRLRLSNEATDQVQALVANHMKFADVLKMRESTLKRFLRLRCFPEHLRLHYLDCTNSHGDLELYQFAKQRFENIPEEQVRPQLLVTGRELIDAGYQPGPRFKDMLAFAEDAQLEGKVHTREEAMSLIASEFGAAY
ncbi:MAG: CCA tRNA nucleotidyltransferase [Acidobacteriaceae bacterium]